MVTLPDRPLISESEWLVTTNFTMVPFFFGSVTKRTPFTSICFCSTFVFAPALADGLSTVDDGAGPFPTDPRLEGSSQYTPLTTPPMASANRIVISHTG